MEGKSLFDVQASAFFETLPDEEGATLIKRKKKELEQLVTHYQPGIQNRAQQILDTGGQEKLQNSEYDYKEFAVEEIDSEAILPQLESFQPEWLPTSNDAKDWEAAREKINKMVKKNEEETKKAAAAARKAHDSFASFKSSSVASGTGKKVILAIKKSTCTK